MQHQIDPKKVGSRGTDMAQAIQACVHCGFCLPTCPTYQLTGDEAESPRGRILMMKHVLEGSLLPEQINPHIDRCLGCLACETHCPSGVSYSHLLSPYRDWVHSQSHSPRSWTRWLILQTLPYPFRFLWAMRTGRLLRFATNWLPRSLRPLLNMIPSREEATPVPLESLTVPRSDQRPLTSTPTTNTKVALLRGCAQRVLDPHIHAAAERVLAINGIPLEVPTGQGCCGALAWHLGYGQEAQATAWQNIQRFGPEWTAVLSTAAGCGSAMKEYPILFRGTPHESAAQAFSLRVQDILEFLAQLELQPFPPRSQTIRIAYHDACHLAHAQGIRQAPRHLLLQIPNVELVPLTDSDRCCGSAGTYNIDQPELAHQLGQKKADDILAAHCDVVALANIGCEVQIRKHLRQRGSSIPILHVVEILDLAYAGKLTLPNPTPALNHP